jgi:hypothetical protein
MPLVFLIHDIVLNRVTLGHSASPFILAMSCDLASPLCLHHANAHVNVDT